MAVSSTYKRLLLRKLYADAVAASATLLATLTSFATSKITATQDGLFVTGTSADGHRVDYSLPGAADSLSPVDVAEAGSELLDLYDREAAELTTPTDAEIYTAMLAAIRPVTRLRPDFRGACR